jgi:virulence factor Mce-like protein
MLMSGYRRNVVIGVVVLTSLGILLWMLFVFGDSPASLFAEKTFRVTFVTEQADGLGQGSNVFYRGVIVGRVDSVELHSDFRRVTVHCLIAERQPVPANVEAVIRLTGLIGGVSAVHLIPVNGEPRGAFAAGTEMPARFAGLDFLPPEFTQLANDLRETSKKLRDSNMIDEMATTVKTVRGSFERATALMESIEQITGDASVQGDLRTAIAQLKEASTSAANLTGRLDAFAANDLPKLSSQSQEVLGEAKTTLAEGRTAIADARSQITTLGDSLGKRLDELAASLDSVKSISAKIDSGTGTAGQLVNDPKLYQSFVDTTRQLNMTLNDLNRLVKQWEQEGVRLKIR